MVGVAAGAGMPADIYLLSLSVARQMTRSAMGWPPLPAGLRVIVVEDDTYIVKFGLVPTPELRRVLGSDVVSLTPSWPIGGVCIDGL